MKILLKEGDEFHLLAFPRDKFMLGDYFKIEDKSAERSLILQVIEAKYANVPGILEELLRDGLSGRLEGNDLDPFDITSQITILKDTRLIICKIRGIIEGGLSNPYGSFIPSRNFSSVKPLSIESLIDVNGIRRPIELGETVKGVRLSVDAESFDGKLNIITGRKGTGKSHLSKLFVLGLVDHGAPCLILDINGEYVNLKYNREEKCHENYRNKLLTLTPGLNLRFNIQKLGLNPLLNMLTYALDLPWNSTRVFIRIWRELLRNGKLCLEELSEEVNRWRCHESVRDAIQSRLHSMMDSGMFTDHSEDSLDLTMTFKSIGYHGSAIIVNLKDQSSISRRMLVELLLGKLKDLLSRGIIPPLFLFAEEAHLYLRETYWDDIVTRMRHLGLFTTFITNQPDSIQESIYRQVDNIFLFNFINDKDLEAISRTAKIDADSVKLMVKELPPKHCLVIGDTVRNFPIIVKVKDLEVRAMGETRLFFKTITPNARKILTH